MSIYIQEKSNKNRRKPIKLPRVHFPGQSSTTSSVYRSNWSLLPRSWPRYIANFRCWTFNWICAITPFISDYFEAVLHQHNLKGLNLPNYLWRTIHSLGNHQIAPELLKIKVVFRVISKIEVRLKTIFYWSPCFCLKICFSTFLDVLTVIGR